MPLTDKLVLGPIEKYKIYSKAIENLIISDRFPYKLIIQVALVIFTTAQIELEVKEIGLQNASQ